jgi:hypothetical protein
MDDAVAAFDKSCAADKNGGLKSGGINSDNSGIGLLLTCMAVVATHNESGMPCQRHACANADTSLDSKKAATVR